MTYRTISELTCDRCGLVDQCPPERWAKLRIKAINAPAGHDALDICPDCFRAWQRFFVEGKPHGAAFASELKAPYVSLIDGQRHE
jgi:hypothetical protein